jgi:hypothetical protein
VACLIVAIFVAIAREIMRLSDALQAGILLL